MATSLNADQKKEARILIEQVHDSFSLLANASLASNASLSISQLSVQLGLGRITSVAGLGFIGLSMIFAYDGCWVPLSDPTGILVPIGEKKLVVSILNQHSPSGITVVRESRHEAILRSMRNSLAHYNYSTFVRRKVRRIKMWNTNTSGN